MRALKIITGHVIYNPVYTYKFQLKTTQVVLPNNGIYQIMIIWNIQLQDILIQIMEKVSPI